VGVQFVHSASLARLFLVENLLLHELITLLVNFVIVLNLLSFQPVGVQLLYFALLVLVLGEKLLVYELVA